MRTEFPGNLLSEFFSAAVVDILAVWVTIAVIPDGHVETLQSVVQ